MAWVGQPRDTWSTSARKKVRPQVAWAGLPRATSATSIWVGDFRTEEKHRPGCETLVDVRAEEGTAVRIGLGRPAARHLVDFRAEESAVRTGDFRAEEKRR
ncbi:MAG: hypothetical protein AB7J86_41280, partial [Vulcanimicrobiota bacterium]